MSERTMKIILPNRLGLHVRAATLLVKTAESFQSEITVSRDGFDAQNAKSILSVLTLAAAKGCELTFSARGADADAAIEALRTLIQNRFGEAD